MLLVATCLSEKLFQHEFSMQKAVNVCFLKTFKRGGGQNSG